MELRHKEVKYDQWAVKRRAQLNQSGSRVLTRNLSAALSLKVEIENFINFVFHQILPHFPWNDQLSNNYKQNHRN